MWKPAPRCGHLGCIVLCITSLTVAARVTKAEVNQAEVKRLGAALAQRYAALEKAAGQIPPDRFDPQAIIEIVGRDPSALTGWVGQQTRLLPYRGALRGSVGVLMDRGGNSLDRALLLAELLQSAGMNVRLANAQFTEAQAEGLLADTLAPSRTASESRDGDELSAARQQVTQTTNELLKALGPVNPDLSRLRHARVAALADHWWVQRQQAGNWIDVDITAADLQPLTAAARTFPVTDDGGFALPADAFHEVELRVVIESFQGGSLHTERVLSHTFRVAETFERSIQLMQSPGTLPDGTLTFASGDAAGRNKTLAGLSTWIPVLRIGQSREIQCSFTTDGTVEKNPAVDPRGLIGNASGKVVGGLGGALGGEDAPAAAADTLSAQWIEYEIRAPGEKPRTVRREIFDLIGPAARAAGLKTPPAFTDEQKARRSLRMLGQTHVLLQRCEFSATFVDHHMARESLREKGIWMNLVDGTSMTPAAVFRQTDRLSGADFDTTREVALARSALAPAAAKTFIDAPNVLHARLFAEPKPDGSLSLHRSIDLAFTSTAATGIDAGAFADRVAQGVADTWAEHVAAGDESTTSENAACLFATASAAGRAPIMLRSVDEPALAALKLPADSRARMRDDLKSGHVLVVARGDGERCGWWRIDPATGQTVGVMDNGFNADDVEYPVLQARVDAMTQGVPYRVNPGEFVRGGVDDFIRWRGRSITVDEWAAARQLQGDILRALCG